MQRDDVMEEDDDEGSEEDDDDEDDDEDDEEGEEEEEEEEEEGEEVIQCSNCYVGTGSRTGPKRTVPKRIVSCLLNLVEYIPKWSTLENYTPPQ